MYTQAIKQNPGWKIGTSTRGEEERAQRKRNYPPPDTYDPNMHAAKQKMASWSFGTSKRSNFAGGNKNPGPNSYEIKTRVGEAPAYGMALKLDSQSLIG